MADGLESSDSGERSLERYAEVAGEAANHRWPIAAVCVGREIVFRQGDRSASIARWGCGALLAFAVSVLLAELQGLLSSPAGWSIYACLLGIGLFLATRIRKIQPVEYFRLEPDRQVLLLSSWMRSEGSGELPFSELAAVVVSWGSVDDGSEAVLSVVRTDGAVARLFPGGGGDAEVIGAARVLGQVAGLPVYVAARGRAIEDLRPPDTGTLRLRIDPQHLPLTTETVYDPAVSSRTAVSSAE
ncbi:MAG: hypothetical protein ACK47B_27280 [Armatimonadota bacterium]